MFGQGPNIPTSTQRLSKTAAAAPATMTMTMTNAKTAADWRPTKGVNPMAIAAHTASGGRADLDSVGEARGLDGNEPEAAASAGRRGRPDRSRPSALAMGEGWL